MQIARIPGMTMPRDIRGLPCATREVKIALWCASRSRTTLAKVAPLKIFAQSLGDRLVVGTLVELGNGLEQHVRTMLVYAQVAKFVDLCGAPHTSTTWESQPLSCTPTFRGPHVPRSPRCSVPTVFGPHGGPSGSDSESGPGPEPSSEAGSGPESSPSSPPQKHAQPHPPETRTPRRSPRT